jgi:hypothetical protein
VDLALNGDFAYRPVVAVTVLLAAA